MKKLIIFLIIPYMLTLQQVFELGLKIGIAADPRGGDGVKRHLARIKGQFDDLKEDERQYFDKNRLANPYDDSRIHVGDLRAPVKRVLAGIDIGAGEILLASQLNERGKKIDAIIAHHPIGGSLAALADVMDMVVDVYEQIGVPVHAAEKIMELVPCDLLPDVLELIIKNLNLLKNVRRDIAAEARVVMVPASGE